VEAVVARIIRDFFNKAIFYWLEDGIKEVVLDVGVITEKRV
jgi:hypothetical protein